MLALDGKGLDIATELSKIYYYGEKVPENLTKIFIKRLGGLRIFMDFMTILKAIW